MRVSLMTSIKSPKIVGEKTIDEVLTLIKGGYTKEQVLKAREAGKGSDLYESIKTTIPTWTPNGCFDKVRAARNLIDISGFIYIDIDDEFEASVICDMPFIYAAWHSLSGFGYGMLVKVDNLTKENFTAAWLHTAEILSQYGIVVDKQTKDISRQNVISCDSSIYNNPDCIPIDMKDVFVETQTVVDYPFNDDFDVTIGSKDYVSDDTSNSKIAYTTTLDDYKGQDYIVIEEGKGCRYCFLPKSVGTGNRHRWLAGYIISLLYINPKITMDELIKVVMRANNRHMLPPKRIDEVRGLITFYFELHLKGELNYNTSLKKIWINPESNLSTTEKRRIIGREVGKLRRGRTLESLIEAYLQLQDDFDRVTQKMLAEKSGLSERTVKTYWHEILGSV